MLISTMLMNDDNDIPDELSLWVVVTEKYDGDVDGLES